MKKLIKKTGLLLLLCLTILGATSQSSFTFISSSFNYEIQPQGESRPGFSNEADLF